MKILVLYAGFGGGHKAAAEAIYEELIRKNYNAYCVDALDLRPSSKQGCRKAHLALGAKLPFVWWILYVLFDSSIMQDVARVASKFLDKLLHYFRPLEIFLKQEKFSYIINTQAVTAQVCVHLKSKSIIKAKLICAITDFYAHYSWISQEVDYYAVASDYTKIKLIKSGIQAAKIIVTGIAVNKKFQSSQDYDILKKTFKLKENFLIVLITAGSLGVGPINKLVSGLTSCQLIVVCGHNKKLYKQLKTQECDRIRLYEFVDNMHELMSIANVMVTKPGGLTISEALVKNLPLIFFTAIPGQETNNIKVLKFCGIPTRVLSAREIIEQINEYSRSPQKIESIRSAMRSCAQPFAARNIVNLIDHK